MQIETKFFGLREVAEDDIITFEHGIPGFEDNHDYTIMQYKEGSPFFVLQSLQLPDLALILIEFSQISPGFSFDISDDDVTELGLTDAANAITYAVAVLPADISKATVNLAAPIIICNQTKKAKQIIINNPAYSLRHPLFDMQEPMANKKTAVR